MHDVASFELLVLDILASDVGEYVALADRSVRVPESPRLAGLILKRQEQEWSLRKRCM
jgi:hypothetical protein